MQLSGHPHELDLIAQIVDELRALPLRPARIFQLAQQEIGLAVFLQHCDALRFGRMRGQHRTDAQIRDELLDFLGPDAAPRRLGQNMAKGAAELLAAALALYLAPPAHGRVLLGDGEELEPDALRLQRPGHELRRDIGNGSAALEQRLDLGLMLARHVEQEPEQKLCGLARRGARDQRRRGGVILRAELLDVVLHDGPALLAGR